MLRAMGGIGAIGLAGCVGSVPGGSGGSAGDWPPARVDGMYFQSSSRFSVVHQLWSQYVNQYMPVDTQVTNTQIGPSPGVLVFDEMMTGTPGHAYVSNMVNTVVMLPFLAEREFDYDLTQDITVLHQYFGSVRGICVSHHSTPADHHFYWTWDEYLDYCNNEHDGPFRFGMVGGHHYLQGSLMAEFDDRITLGETWEFVQMPDGGTTRQAILRGDLDGYFAGFPTNYVNRNEFYKTQFIMGDPERYPAVAESLMGFADQAEDGYDGGIPDHSWITNTSFPLEGARKVVDVTGDNLIAFVNAETPDEIVADYTEAFTAASEDEDLHQDILDAYGADSWGPNPNPEEATQLFRENHALVHDDPVVRNAVETHVLGN